MASRTPGFPQPMRVGKAAGLRCRSVEAETQPLGRLFVCTSYNTGTRRPVKAGSLRFTQRSRRCSPRGAVTAGRRSWARTDRGRSRLPTAGHQDASGWRDADCHRHPEALPPRPRDARLHPMARARPPANLHLVGAHRRRREAHPQAVHPRRPEGREGYTTFEFEVVCREVANLKLRGRGDVIRLARAVGEGPLDDSGTSEGATSAFATVLATVGPRK
jgi:hypothetical protein